MTTTTTRPPEEVEAAELEGFVEVGDNPVIVGLFAGYKTHRFGESNERKAKSRIGDRIIAALTEHGAKAFTIGGVVEMRKQVVDDTTVFDVEQFKIDHPKLFAEYNTKTKAGSVRVWVRPQTSDDLSEEEEIS